MSVSGFTRDTKYYGDELVYEALGSKKVRYRCCGLCRAPRAVGGRKGVGSIVTRPMGIALAPQPVEDQQQHNIKSP